MHRKAYAKLTLFLHATDRVDGMLHFKNIIVPIDLFDMVYLDVNEEMLIETDKAYLPNDKRNTVFKALMVMKERFSIKDNFKVRIVKNIPAQAGLGGGSADAAAVIHMVNERYSLNLTREDLIDIAREIDEDTPYCLFNEPMIVEGVGDILTPIATEIELYYVMVKPPFGVSTRSFLRRFRDFKSLDGFHQCLKSLNDNDAELLFKSTYNDFQRLVIRRNSRLKRVVRTLEKNGLKGVCMSGSGTTIYGLTENKDHAIEVYEKIALHYPFVKYGAIHKRNE